MTKKELTYVLTVAQEKSISRAAEKLFITQPSLSNAIKKIEESLGTKLFTRTNRGLHPTYAGERYCEVANKLIHIYEDFENEIGDINNLKKGRLKIGITSYLSTHILPKVLPKYKEIAPNIEFSFVELTSIELENELRRGSMDFVIMSIYDEDERQSDQGLNFTAFERNPFYLVTRRHHPLKTKAQKKNESAHPYIDLSLIENEVFMLGIQSQRSRQVVDNILNQSGYKPQKTLTMRNYVTAKSLVREGLGVSIIPSLYLDFESDTEHLDLYSIESSYKPYMTFCVATRLDGYLSNAAQLMIELIGDAVGKDDLLKDVMT